MVQVVWFKRDLRIADHAPLAAALKAGPVLALIVVEPDYWRQPDIAGRHYAFYRECVESLRKELAGIGMTLIARTGAAEEVLADIHRRTPITALHSHMEIGNGWTYARDKRVARWCSSNSIPWQQPRQFGIVRAHNNRDKWAAQWEAFMTSAIAPKPAASHMAQAWNADALPTPDALGLADDPCPDRQIGGRANALALLDSFLAGRGARYQREMSSPNTAAEACSRLSTHLAFGTLSMREVVQRAYYFRTQLAEVPKQTRSFDIKSIDAFIARLHWHCHFIQKLEDEPAVEFRTFHPAFENARLPHDDNAQMRLEAWAEGATGWPFVDACMRSLKATGWINFRMRAMLVAIASYHLWLDWRQTGAVLARRFTDYEPGIHWSQMQMQSGTTAINTLRIYNPVKQSMDQDPDGNFIRQWVPELAHVPTDYIHAPWELPPLLAREIDFQLGRDYPAPIIDHIKAARLARAKITAIRQAPGFRENQLQILQKHGSRKGKNRRDFPSQERMIKKTDDEKQMRLDF